jgi:tetratricopeptide (TPR) repeat protein
MASGLVAEPLRALRRGLTRAAGFALYVAVVKTPAQRNQLITLLAEAVPAIKLQTVTLRADSTDILDEIQQQLGGPPSGPVMLTGLETVLPSDAPNHPILNALNLRRPDWPQRISQPVVFWVPEYLLGVLARSAPDFLDWRSDTIHFPDLQPAQFEVLKSVTWGGGIDTRLPAAARRERIRELESRIAANEDSNDTAICPVVADWLNEQGLHFRLFGEMQAALGCFEKVLAIARGLGDRRREVAALANLGIIYAEMGDLRKPIELFRQGLGICQKLGDLPAESDLLGNLASANFATGNFRDAGQFYEQSLKLHRRLGNLLGQGRDLLGIGSIYTKHQKFSDAIPCFEEALGIFRAAGARKELSNVLGNLGVVYRQQGDIQKAIGFFEQAIVADRDLGDKQGERRDLGNLGNAYATLGDLPKAINLFNEALAIASEVGDRRGEGGILLNCALALDQSGDREGAIARAEQALKIFEVIEDPHVGEARAMLARLRQ